MTRGHPRDLSRHPGHRLSAASLRRGGEAIDAPGRRVVGAKGKPPLWRPYLPVAMAMSKPLCTPLVLAAATTWFLADLPAHGHEPAKPAQAARLDIIPARLV